MVLGVVVADTGGVIKAEALSDTEQGQGQMMNKTQGALNLSSHSSVTQVQSVLHPHFALPFTSVPWPCLVFRLDQPSTY
jgi:hypothetical protein